jgi:hydroxyacyl-ACP dehydratase HTD2-like protein with hotdog domain
MSRFSDIRPGDTLPERIFEPDNVQLFLYNAALWNAHRIHFDEPYATAVEHYPGLVIAGPLLGDWLHQCLLEWLGDDGMLASVEYSNRIASYIGESLRSGGKVMRCDASTREVEVEVFIMNEADEVIAPGVAIVRFAEA